MIHTLINLLASFYESNDLRRAETIARSIHTAVPEDQVSLKFLGIVYYRTGRIKDAIRLFDQVQCRQQASLAADGAAAEHRLPAVASAVAAFSLEAARRVPYLAQAWLELGNALQKMRSFDCAASARRLAQVAQPALA